jgi:patatin-like phospholipase
MVDRDPSVPEPGRLSYRDRIDAPGPKKLLALHGGGVRGVITLELLSEIETMLRRETGADETFVLADYFDYVAGTSTGAIIAAGLARGMPVDELRLLYSQHGADMFDKASIRQRFLYKYESGGLKDVLQNAFGASTTFGDESLRTLLMMVLRNATTDSPWPLSNNPRAMYNDPARDDNNLEIPLWQLVRASTAAPTYFASERIRVGEQTFVFVDGGVTMFNNPTFQLFLMATHDAYGLNWPTGEHELLLVSVGTGHAPKVDDHLRPGDMNLLFNARSVPAALMSAALHQQDALCRILGRCRHGAPLDTELRDLIGGPGILPERLFTYVNYNATLTREGLTELGLPDVDPATVQSLDSAAHVRDLQRVGLRAAKQVDRHHFDGFLTLRP